MVSSYITNIKTNGFLLSFSLNSRQEDLAMTFKRNGFVVRTAYPEGAPSGKINICPLFKRFFGNLCLLGLDRLAAKVLPAVGWLVAMRIQPELKKPRGVPSLLVPYENWPRIRGHRVWPIAVIGLFLAVWLGTSSPATRGFYTGFGVLVTLLAFALAFLALAMGVAFATGILALGVGLVAKKTAELEVWKLVGGYLKAAWNRVCFQVDIVD